jgi:hypothetical protein
LSRRYRAVVAAELPAYLADRIQASPAPGPALRVAFDGPACADPAGLSESVLAVLAALGRPGTVIPADSFWRDASVRLEFGRTDVDSLPNWLDSVALAREVLTPLGAGGSGAYLPSLRDPATNRSTRATPLAARPGEVVLVAGAFLLGNGLEFDMSVHLAVSSAARARQTPADEAWTLPAFDAYDSRVRPAEIADISVRWDDPARPAVSD